MTMSTAPVTRQTTPSGLEALRRALDAAIPPPPNAATP